MIGNLLQQARIDAAAIAMGGGFSVTANLTTPDNSLTLPVVGLATGSWAVFDNLQSGKPENSISNSFDIPVEQLKTAAYPYLKGGLVSLQSHTIQVVDPNGNLNGTFKITETHPNATLGLIVCILGVT